jgi:hypothetical protein
MTAPVVSAGAVQPEHRTPVVGVDALDEQRVAGRAA